MTPSFLRPGWVGFASLAVIGTLNCAGPTTRLTDTLDSQYRLSPDHLIHYRPPLGWVEIALPEDTPDLRLWLVSPGLNQSLQIREVQMDSAAAGLLKEQGPFPLVQLMHRMELEDGGHVRSQLEMSREGERTCWTFSGTNREGLPFRVSMFVISERMFECRSTGQQEERVSEIHGAFLAALRW